MGDKNLTIGTFHDNTKFDIFYNKNIIEEETGVENKNYKILKKEILNKTISEMDDFMNLVEAKYRNPCVRKIQVNMRNGSKVPIGEKSNMTKEQIMKDRGTGNNYSLAIKYCKSETGRLYCVDFDSKQLDNCDLFNQLNESNTFRCETNKGYHFYIHMNGSPEYKCETKCGIGPVRDIDLICQKRNIWEPITREMTGNEIKEYDWGELEHHYNHAIINIQG